MSESPLNRMRRKLSSNLYRHLLIYLPRPSEKSDEPVTVVIPLAEKDIAQAKTTIQSARQNLLHPIKEIIIPGQSSTAIADFCRDEGLTYIDEASILSASVLSIDYKVGTSNRNGWIRQQILKMMADTYSTTRYALILDADTAIVRPLSFMRGGKPILFTADEFHASYHSCNQRLLGPLKKYKDSFVAHTMLMDGEVLQSIRTKLEERSGLTWADAIVASIDRQVPTGFSEYELYGTYVYNFLPEIFQPEYWYNRKYAGEGPFDMARLPASFRRQNFVSKHIKV